MGDLVLRVSLLVQRGYLCSSCGVVIDGELSPEKRVCSRCSHDFHAEDRHVNHTAESDDTLPARRS